MVVIISPRDQYFLTDGNAKGAMMMVVMFVMMDCCNAKDAIMIMMLMHRML